MKNLCGRGNGNDLIKDKYIPVKINLIEFAGEAAKSDDIKEPTAKRSPLNY